MNVNLFKYYQALNGDDGKSTSEALGISRVTLSNKLNGRCGDFTRGEIAILKSRWNLTDTEFTQVFLKG